MMFPAATVQWYHCFRTCVPEHNRLLYYLFLLNNIAGSSADCQIAATAKQYPDLLTHTWINAKSIMHSFSHFRLIAYSTETLYSSVH